jgi:pyruvate dehydrogenase E1 component beta subunit
MTVREALRDAMAEEMRRDPTVFLMGEEVAQYQGAYKVSQGLLEEFGAERVIDTPITEHGFAGLGVGAAFGGLVPIVEFMTMNFAMQAMDQIINSAAKTRYMSGGQMGCPIVFRGPNGRPRASPPSTARITVPGTRIFPGESDRALISPPMPRACSNPRSAIPIRSSSSKTKSSMAARSRCRSSTIIVPIGKARVIKAGAHVTLVAHSICVGLILEAAEKLAAEGIDAELIDLRTLRPLDTATVIESVKKTNRIVTVEQGWPICSIGSEIARRWSSRRSIISTRRRPRSRARTYRCPMPPISRSSRCRMSTTWSRRRNPFAIGNSADGEWPPRKPK